MTAQDRSTYIDKIRALPIQLEELIEGLSTEQLTTPYLKGEWTVAQNIHHLADSHMNSYIRIKLMLTGLFIYLFFLVWGIDATAWVASAGIIGIAVGFAARDTIANLISGVSIVADAPYKIGDYIVLDSGERGVVPSLGIRSTRLMTRDDVEVSIPNAVIGTAKIINESGGPKVRHRIRIPIGVAYDSDIDQVIDTLKEIAADNEIVVGEPAPRVRIRGFGDNAINLELLGWIRRPADRGLAIHRLNHAIIHRFRERDIQIPFPQRDLHFPADESPGEANQD